MSKKIYAQNADITNKLTTNELNAESANITTMLTAASAKIPGLVCANEVRVSLSCAPCWPDYVFSKDY